MAERGEVRLESRSAPEGGCARRSASPRRHRAARRSSGIRLLFGSEAAAAALIGAVGLVALVLVASHALNNYLRPDFLPVVGLAALALIGLALWTVLTDPGPAEHGECLVHPASWFLAVPLVLAAFVAPTPLGAALLDSGGAADSALSQRITVRPVPVPEAAGGRPEAPQSDAPDAPARSMTMEQLVSTWIFGPREGLIGRRVAVLGFAAPTVDGHWNLARYKIVCCAADAIAYQARLEGGDTSLAVDRWYEVEAVVTGRDVDKMPILEVERVVEVPVPDVPYM